MPRTHDREQESSQEKTNTGFQWEIQGWVEGDSCKREKAFKLFWEREAVDADEHDSRVLLNAPGSSPLYHWIAFPAPAFPNPITASTHRL